MRKFIFPVFLIFNLLIQAQNIDLNSNKKNSITLPADFPPLTINTVNNPSKGRIFFSPSFFGGGVRPYGDFLIIIDENGNVVNFKRISIRAFDFKIQPNGLITYALNVEQGGEGQQGIFYIMDSTLTVIDSVKAVGSDSLGNKYITDAHELLILPNGHYVLTIKDPKIMDMTQFGGQSNATVIGGIIQELDVNKNLVFQWRSWDHIAIDDTYGDLTRALVKPNHFNTVGITNDGNFLLGNRTNDEIIKIDRKTGDMLWRMGGKDNQFTFIGENPTNAPNYFSAHDIRMLPNGNITLFDNGNIHTPWISRAVEYRIDQVNKTATFVWDFQHNPTIQARIMGSVQRLPNGNTLINWGAKAQDPTSADITEVRPDKSVAFELTLPKDYGSYRAFKYPWNIFEPKGIVTNNNLSNNQDITFNNSTDTTGLKLHINNVSSTSTNDLTIKKFDLAPVFPKFLIPAPKVFVYRVLLTSTNITSLDCNISFDISAFPNLTDLSKIKVYFRSTPSNNFAELTTIYDNVKNRSIVSNTGLGEYIFAKNDIVTGITKNKVIPSKFSLEQNFPNPFNPSTTISYSLPTSSFVQINVYDLLGRLVKTLVNEEKKAGEYSIKFIANQLSSGIYFYRIQADNFVQTKKLILLK